MIWSPFFKGFGFGLGLIAAIGMQNVFVLKQGLMRQQVFWVVLTCFLCDVVLMGFGVFGVGEALSNSPILSFSLALFGALFVLIYGLRTLYSAWRGSSGMNVDTMENTSQNALKAVAMALVLTLLNPQAYIDTLLLTGSLAVTFDSASKPWLYAGIVCASFVWFFGIGYGAAWASPLLRSRAVWRVIDLLIGVFLLSITAYLLDYAYRSWQLL